MEAPVHPEARSDAAAAIGSFQWSAVVVVIPGCFKAFDQSDFLEHRTLNLARSLSNGVVQPEFHWIHAQLLAELVHDLLHAKRGLR